MFESDEYTADQGALAEFAARLAEEFDYAYFLDNARKGGFPERFWQVLSRGGYLGLLAPERYGGAGARLADMVVFIHNLARRGLASHQLLNQIACGELIAHSGRPEEQSHLLPELLSGHLCALALTEHAQGSNPFDVATRAVPDGTTLTLRGAKRFVAGAARAWRLLLIARTGEFFPDAPTRGLELFLLDPKTEGVEIVAREVSVRVSAEHEPVMITGDAFCDLIFDCVPLTANDRIGEPGAAGPAVTRAIDLLFILNAVMALGWGESVLEKAVEHARNRVIFEEPIGAYQAIQHPMVRARTELELAKLAITRAVDAYTAEDEQTVVYASAAKCAASEAAYAACDIAIQALGGAGFDRETGVIPLWPLILLSRILPQNNDAILEHFAEAALDLP